MHHHSSNHETREGLLAKVTRGMKKEEFLEGPCKEFLAMSQPIVALKKNPVLASLTTEELTALLQKATYRTFTAGEILLEAGQHGDSMLLVVSGKVEVLLNDIQIALHEDSHILGEMALIDPGPRSASAIARSSGALYELPRQVLWSMFLQGDAVAVKIIQNLTTLLCQRLEHINQLVQDEVTGEEPQPGVFRKLWNRFFKKS